MTERKMRKLSRVELLEMLLEQGEENEQLQALLKEKTDALESRELKIKEAGTMAEASLGVNGVLEAAQKAADQYLENVKALNDRQMEICSSLEAESKKKAEALLAETEAKCKAMEEETEKKCLEMLKKTEAEIRMRWKNASEKLEEFTRQYAELQKQLLNFDTEQA